MKQFRGGVHPNPHKAESENRAIEPLCAGQELVYPLSQHIGAPAVPIVSVGDTVKKGQKIAAAAEGKLSVPIHSAVSGTVKKIENRMTIGGKSEPCIVIENDGLYTLADGVGVERDFSDMDADQILDAIQEAGLVGMGGAGFPTEAKLRGALDRSIEWLLFNGAECEPYLTDDYRLMVERADDLIAGVRLWMRLFPRAQAVIGVEDNKPEAIRTLRKAAQGTGIRVAALRTRYPQGSERTLIYAITGKKVPTAVLPLEAGCIIQNVATVIAGYEAVRYRMPLISRTMTVSGDGVVTPKNFDVPIGTDYQTVLDAAGGLKADVQKIISGGPMTGVSLTSTAVPVTKTTSAVLAFLHDEVAKSPTTACIRCGRCVAACPVRLVPQKLVRLVDAGNLEEYERLGGLECIACGACSYSCPAHIPLTQAFRYAKQEIGARRRKGGR